MLSFSCYCGGKYGIHEEGCDNGDYVPPEISLKHGCAVNTIYDKLMYEVCHECERRCESAETNGWVATSKAKAEEEMESF